jgi:opacity protein-like surface antigen
MKAGAISILVVGCCVMSAAAGAQSRDAGWEFGGDISYQPSQDMNEQGTDVSFDDDIGLSLYAGYRMSPRLEFQFGLDWSTVDYNATFPSPINPGTTIGVDTELEAFTPFAKANFNFVDGPITPFITAGIGWAFIDTNIPDGLPQTGCWWDPWYGQICSTFQETKSSDAFTYDVGLGVRWDLSTGYSLRAVYEKHWYDAESGSPDFDRFKLGVVFVY